MGATKLLQPGRKAGTMSAAQSPDLGCPDVMEIYAVRIKNNK
jgi:hypothetical protein